MKIEICENTHNVIIATVIGVVLVVLFLTIYAYNVQELKVGYHEDTTKAYGPKQ